MRSHRFRAMAAVCAIGFLLAGCGGGNSTPTAGTVSTSGRFAVQDVTPTDVSAPSAGTVLRNIEVQAVSRNGLVATGVYRKAARGNSTAVEKWLGVIDVAHNTFTRITHDDVSPDTRLVPGVAYAVTTTGDVYGSFIETDPATGFGTKEHTFVYSHATGTATLIAPETLRPSGVSDDGQIVVQRNAGSVVVPFASPSGAGRLISSPLPDYTAYASSINATGTVLGYLAYPGSTGSIPPPQQFAWNNGVVTVLAPLVEGRLVRAYFAGTDGRIVGVARDADDVPHVVIWQDGVLSQLPDPPLAFDDFAVIGFNSRGDLLIRLDARDSAGAMPNDPPSQMLRSSVGKHLLWQNGTWIDLSREVTAATTPFPFALLDDGRLVCNTPLKLYTLTPR